MDQRVERVVLWKRARAINTFQLLGNRISLTAGKRAGQ